RDPAAALAAWDAYLAAEPAGRFAIEAKFNRALTLVRLGRYHEAEAALAPFARGEVSPAGYRRDEATLLVERLARVNGPERCGDYEPCASPSLSLLSCSRAPPPPMCISSSMASTRNACANESRRS